MPATYEPIAIVTLGSDTTDVEFTSIPGTFTDLRLVTSILGSGASAIDVDFRFNGDTGTNYSWTHCFGNGAAVFGGRTTSWTSLRVGFVPGNTGTAYSATQIDVMSYANTNVFKTALVSHAAPNNFVVRNVGTWRNTGAITSLRVIGAFRSGSTFSLYGIKAA